MAEEQLKEMSFMDHLGALRVLLMRASLGILIAAGVAFFFRNWMFDELLFGPTRPNFITYDFFCRLSQQFGLDDSLCVSEMPFIIQNVNMGGQVSVLIWACIAAGFVLAFPYVGLQVWKFISPALYEKERKQAVKFVFITSLLFFLGVLFGYYIVAPLSVNFFGTFSVSKTIVNEFNLESYIGMMKTSTLASGLLFQLPVVVYFLTSMGLVGPDTLRQYRKHTLVGVLVLSAILTPPDVLSQIIVAIPIMLLYEVSIWVSALMKKKERTA